MFKNNKTTNKMAKSSQTFMLIVYSLSMHRPKHEEIKMFTNIILCLFVH
jgi:hypothetical protein